MGWRFALFSKEIKTRKSHLELLRFLLRDWFSHWWLLVLSLILLAIGLGLVLHFELIGLESARWTLSALVQAGAALIGIFFVALSLLWHQATQEREKLKGLMDNYILTFGSNTAAVADFISTLSEVVKGDVFKSTGSVREKVADCFTRIVVLQYAASMYAGKEGSLEKLIEQVPVEELIERVPVQELRLSKWDIEFTKWRIKGTASDISRDEVLFFEYLLGFDGILSLLARELKLANKGSFHLSEALHRARSVDQVGMSSYKVRFFKAFSGAVLKAVSLMWLLSLITGLFVLVSLDSIPASLLTPFVLTPISIGVIAIGTTLSLGFSAMRSEV